MSLLSEETAKSIRQWAKRVEKRYQLVPIGKHYPVDAQSDRLRDLLGAIEDAISMRLDREVLDLRRRTRMSMQRALEVMR